MNQSLNQLLILLVFLFSFQTIQSRQKFTHPRGLLKSEELITLRQKVERQPWKDMMIAMRSAARQMEISASETNQDSSAIARIYAYLYTLSGEKADAETAWKYADGVLNNPTIFNNPVSRGLIRARLLRDMAETYDLCFTATAKRVRGHQGFDNLGFRILGLGSIWAVGAGRTSQVAGHTCLFPVSDIANHSGEKGALGKVLQTHFDDDGSGKMTATGSCMGVANHGRTFQADYSKKSGSEAVFIITDRSDNGKIWRMNSPEFNELKINSEGFTLISPDGAELKAVVFTDAPKLKVTSSKIRYGGDTKDHNRGIAFHGKSYAWTNAIDCTTNGNITVVITLQPKGKRHPAIEQVSSKNLKVGESVYSIYNLIVK